MATQDNQTGTAPKGEIFAHLGNPLLEAFIDNKAWFAAYKKYRINKLELWVLKCLAHSCERKQAEIINQTHFIDSITSNPKMKMKINGALIGLDSKGFIGSFEYIRNPGSLSIGLSDLAHKFLAEHVQVRALLADRFGRYEIREHEFNRAVYRPAVFIDLMNERRARFLNRKSA